MRIPCLLRAEVAIAGGYGDISVNCTLAEFKDGTGVHGIWRLSITLLAVISKALGIPRVLHPMTGAEATPISDCDKTQ